MFVYQGVCGKIVLSIVFFGVLRIGLFLYRNYFLLLLYLVQERVLLSLLCSYIKENLAGLGFL